MPTLRLTRKATSLRDVCRFVGRTRVAFVVDLSSNEIYLKAKLRARVAKLLEANSKDHRTWQLNLMGQARRLSVQPFSGLDQSRRFSGHVVGISKSDCIRVPEGRCVNVVDDDDKVAFSFKAPKEFYACSPGEKICIETEQTNTLTIYDKPGCAGPSRVSKETLLFCQPA